MQRGVQQAHRYGQPVHRLQQRGEVGPLLRLELGERVALGVGVGVGSEDDAAHQRQSVTEEHVLSPAQPDTFGAEFPRSGGALGGVRVGPHAEPAHPVGPAEQAVERLVRAGLDHVDLADDHLAGGAVERDHVTLGHGHVPDAEAAGIDVDRDLFGAAHRGIADAAGHDRRVADQATPRGENACSGAMPCTSSGDVSRRTRIIGVSCPARDSASSAVKTTAPLAAPGEAARPLVRTA